MCSNRLPNEFQICSRCAPNVLQTCSTYVQMCSTCSKHLLPHGFQMCYTCAQTHSTCSKCVPRMCSKCLPNLTHMFQMCFRRVTNVIQMCFRCVPCVPNVLPMRSKCGPTSAESRCVTVRSSDSKRVDLVMCLVERTSADVHLLVGVAPGYSYKKQGIGPTEDAATIAKEQCFSFRRDIKTSSLSFRCYP